MIFFINQSFKQKYCITSEVYQNFQMCSKDYNPLHTDESFARSKGFSDKVMYGNIMNAFISHFVGECLPIKDVIILTQSISFKNPVFMNENLDFEAVVSGIYEAVNSIEFKYKFINKTGKIAAKGIILIGVIK